MESTKELPSNELDNFGWEDFDKEDSKEITEEPKEEVQDIEKEEDIFFEEKKSEALKAISPNKVNNNSIYNDVYTDFKEQGLFKFVEIEEGENLDQASFYELQKQEYEAALEEKIKDWADEFDDEGKEFLQFKKQGGKTSDFIKFYGAAKELNLEGDIYDEDYQDYIIRNKMKEEWDSEVIEESLKNLSDIGQKKKQAEKFLIKFQEEEKGKKESLFKELEQKRVYEKQQEDSFNSNLKLIIRDTNEVNGIRFEEKEKDNMYSFLSTKKHKISETEAITDFQKKLGEALGDVSKTLIIAKLLQNDFDFVKLSKDIKNKTVKEIKSNLSQRTSFRSTTPDDFF